MCLTIVPCRFSKAFRSLTEEYSRLSRRTFMYAYHLDIDTLSSLELIRCVKTKSIDNADRYFGTKNRIKCFFFHLFDRSICMNIKWNLCEKLFNKNWNLILLNLLRKKSNYLKQTAKMAINCCV